MQTLTTSIGEHPIWCARAGDCAIDGHISRRHPVEPADDTISDLAARLVQRDLPGALTLILISLSDDAADTLVLSVGQARALLHTVKMLVGQAEPRRVTRKTGSANPGRRI